jgi:uncharacterized protein (TIGR02444 family)
MAQDESPFWRFSLSVYGGAPAAAICLRLQDEHHADVNVLLFVLWLASCNRRLTRLDVEAMMNHVSAWRDDVVTNIRTARRALRSAYASFPPDVVSDLRTAVKRVELEAERLEQEALYDGFPETSQGERLDDKDTAARINVACYAACLGTAFEEVDVDTLCEASAMVWAGTGSEAGR